VRARRPQLLFLDVQMPELDGFGVLAELSAEETPAVVFVTAYDVHALRAFEVRALDYLLKPFSDERFERALERARREIAEHGLAELARRIRGLVDGSAPRPLSAGGETAAGRLLIPQTGRTLVVNVDEIDWIEAADYYACLHVGAATHILRRSLAELENELLPSGFARTHRSTIVNLARIARLTRGSEGEHEIELHDGTRLKLSRHFRRALFAQLGLWNTF